MKQYIVEAALHTDFIWVGRTFRSPKRAIEHAEYVRKIGDHRNLRYRVREACGPVVRAWPKFGRAGA